MDECREQWGAKVILRSRCALSAWSGWFFRAITGTGRWLPLLPKVEMRCFQLLAETVSGCLLQSSINQGS